MRKCDRGFSTQLLCLQLLRDNIELVLPVAVTEAVQLLCLGAVLELLT
jgi:hypothetical protein